MTDTSAATVVLVHGAWHGGWCWDKVTERLDAAGVRSVALDLPMTSLADDVAVVEAALEAVAAPIILCGHSYGGVLISEAGGHRDVRHLVYLCAFALDEGRSAANAVDDELPPTDLGDSFRIDDQGFVTLDRGGARRAFYLDCDPVDADAALGRLRPIALACLTDTTTTAAWRTTASTYAVCTDDRAVHPSLQRVLAGRCTNVLEWPTGHSPFLSRPELVADLLIGLSG